MIEIKQVSKTFADKKVVNNITFKVNEGDIFGFLGPNGAGKTTTIKMIIGLLEPTSGEIFINGKHNVKNKNDIYSDIGVVFELSTYLKNPSILAIVFLPIIMSKIITAAMNIGGQEIFLLSVWILFAQVMVGIMLTGPNIIEEREAKTIDALLCTPFTFREIMFSKGLAILILSMFSQINVYIINRGITSELFALIIPMLIGGSLFILLG